MTYVFRPKRQANAIHCLSVSFLAHRDSGAPSLPHCRTFEALAEHSQRQRRLNEAISIPSVISGAQCALHVIVLCRYSSSTQAQACRYSRHQPSLFAKPPCIGPMHRSSNLCLQPTAKSGLRSREGVRPTEIYPQPSLSEITLQPFRTPALHCNLGLHLWARLCHQEWAGSITQM